MSSEHASHVAMSTTKLLSRIVAPSARDFDASMAESKMCLHDHTYGITSDPLTQFACVLSALIHDAGKYAIGIGRAPNCLSFVRELSY